MRIEIDISGQIQQKSLPSSLGLRRSDGLQKAVLLRETTKRSLLSKYKGKVTNLVEKIHCIMIYYCIKDSLDGVSEIHICNDADFRTIKRLLPHLFDGHNCFKGINVTVRKRSEPGSQGHWPALKAHRRRKNAELIIKESMIEEKLLELDENCKGGRSSR
jgi:hypothetical protein